MRNKGRFNKIFFAALGIASMMAFSLPMNVAASDTDTSGASESQSGVEKASKAAAEAAQSAEQAAGDAAQTVGAAAQAAGDAAQTADPSAAQALDSVTAQAVDDDSSPTLMQWKADDDTIKLYVSGTKDAGKASYKIDGVDVKGLDDSDIKDDEKAMRTLILIDNSQSVSEDLQTKVSDIVKGIINGHGENEKFRLATFSDKINYLQDKYSSDYTATLNVFDTVSYADQETHLIDVLYNAINSLNDEKYMGYDRIIILSAEYDSATTDVQMDELTDLIDEKPYPIYCFGIDTGSNSDQLKEMFELSRSTNADYCVINETETDDIISKTAKDNSLKVYSADIPNDAKNGGSVNSELSFKKADSLKFKVDMPMASKSKNAITIGGMSINIYAFFGAIAGVIVLVIIIAAALIHSKTKEIESINSHSNGFNNNNSQSSFPKSNSYQQGSNTESFANVNRQSEYSDVNDEKTLNVRQPIYDNENSEATDAVAPSANNIYADEEKTTPINLAKKREPVKIYNIILVDENNPNRGFSYKLSGDTARLGIRPSSNDIVIPDDNTVSHNHCVFIVRGSDYFVKDVGSFNGTFINHTETRIPSGKEIRINEGDTLTIGSHSYVFHINVSMQEV